MKRILGWVGVVLFGMTLSCFGWWKPNVVEFDVTNGYGSAGTTNIQRVLDNVRVGLTDATTNLVVASNHFESVLSGRIGTVQSNLDLKTGTGCVSNSMIADGAITATKMAASSVSNSAIVSNAVTTDKIADYAVQTTQDDTNNYVSDINTGAVHWIAFETNVQIAISNNTADYLEAEGFFSFSPGSGLGCAATGSVIHGSPSLTNVWTNQTFGPGAVAGVYAVDIMHTANAGSYAGTDNWVAVSLKKNGIACSPTSGVAQAIIPGQTQNQAVYMHAVVSITTADTLQVWLRTPEVTSSRYFRVTFARIGE